MDFFIAHRLELIQTGIVLLIMFALIITTNWAYRWGIRKLDARGFTTGRKSLRSIKHILISLWVLLAISALSLLFIEGKGSELIRQNVKLAIYLASVFVVTVILGNFSNYWFREHTRKKREKVEDTTNLKFLRYIALISIYFVGFLFVLRAFPNLKGVAQTALGGAGIIAIVAGIASQEALANIIGGFFIIWFRPFKIDDTVRIDNMQGVVTDITLRHTMIRDYDNNQIVIPNSIVNKSRLINYDIQSPVVCERIEIGVSYSSDHKLAQKIMREICEAHPSVLDTRSPKEIEDGVPMVKTAVTRIDDSAIIVRAWAWASNVSDGFGLRYAVLEQAKERFDREGVEIPYPYRSLVIEGDNRENRKTDNQDLSEN